MSAILDGDQKRELFDLPLTAERRYESTATGLIHYPTSETISLYQNFCFCLALFRSLIGDNVQEGKERLKHLLSFKDGSRHFPTYLHEYPKTTPFSCCSIPLKLIEKHFGHILGDELRGMLKGVAPIPPPPEEILTSHDVALAALHMDDLTPLTPYWDPDSTSMLVH